MSSNEAQVRAEAAAACERLAAEYESRLAMMGAELERTQQELAVRTHALAGELNRQAGSVVAVKVCEVHVDGTNLQGLVRFQGTTGPMVFLLHFGLTECA